MLRSSVFLLLVVAVAMSTIAAHAQNATNATANDTTPIANTTDTTPLLCGNCSGRGSLTYSVPQLCICECDVDTATNRRFLDPDCAFLQAEVVQVVVSVNQSIADFYWEHFAYEIFTNLQMNASVGELHLLKLVNVSSTETHVHFQIRDRTDKPVAAEQRLGFFERAIAAANRYAFVARAHTHTTHTNVKLQQQSPPVSCRLPD